MFYLDVASEEQRTDAALWQIARRETRIF